MDSELAGEAIAMLGISSLFFFVLFNRFMEIELARAYNAGAVL